MNLIIEIVGIVLWLLAAFNFGRTYESYVRLKEKVKKND